MSVFSRLFHLFPLVAVFGLALLHAAWSAPAAGRFAKGPLAAPILAGHDYDPISDAVASWTLKPGESVGQSFTVPANGGALRSFRLKLLRVGTAPPLRYGIGTSWGNQDVCSGEIKAEDVPLFFERWCGIDFARPIPLEAGSRYYLQLGVSASEQTGHYEVYGTATDPIEAPNFNSRYQYAPQWGEGSQAEASRFENPANIDYGSRTPRYQGGSAIGAGGLPLESLDLAFQLSSSAPSNKDRPQSEERFAFVEDELLAPLHRKRIQRVARQTGSKGLVEVTPDWSILVSSTSGAVARSAVSDFRQFLQAEMGVAVEVRGLSDFRSAPSSRILLAATRKELPDVGEHLNKSESFRIEASKERIVICGFDERGVMRGLQHLEDLMKFRRAPVVDAFAEERSPLYSPRITSAPFYSTLELELPIDPYTDELLSRISHAGFDSFWMWGELFDVGHSDVYAELDHGVRQRQQKLQQIAERARNYGLDVYVVLAYRPLPESFFKRHPGARGTPFQAYGGVNVPCTSAPEVRQSIREATKNLFTEVPALRGTVFIVGGEGFIHCYTRGMNCPRCSLRSAQEVVAELAGTIQEGVRSGRRDAHVALWPYSASNFWSKDDITQSKLIEKLPPDITFLTEFGKEGLITFGENTIPAYDYPISYLGPSERFSEQSRLVERQGLPLWVKTEHAIALELVQTPYIPVFFRWAERFRRIHDFPRVSGIFANWMHYGFMPSPAAEVFKWHTWSPLPDTETLLRKMARRDFGPGTEQYALAAWRQWSDAISHYPFSGSMAMGPIQKGPAHPLFLNPEYKPVHGHGRQFKNDLSWTRPWGPEVALRQLEQLEAGWQRGVKSWEEVISKAAPQLRANAEREAGVGRAILYCIRSTLHVGRFYQVRDTLWQEKDSGRAAKLWDQLRDIARAELVNAREALQIVSQDSRLGYANSGGSNQTGVPRGGIYSPGSIEKKIQQVKHLLEEEIPEYQRRLGHPKGR